MQRTALVGKKRGDEAIEVTLFLTTVSTTCGAINTPAATGNILTTIATISSLCYAQKSDKILLRYYPPIPKCSAMHCHRSSLELACNKELALLVEVAAVLPLPKNQQIFGDPE